MEKVKMGLFANYLITLEAHENDLLLFNGDQFIWALDTEIDADTQNFRWAAAYYFDDYRMVPPLAEIKKYYDCPFLITDGFSFVIDAENNRAVLGGSNFHQEDRPINKPVSVPDMIMELSIIVQSKRARNFPSPYRIASPHRR